jgi:hypothetical protein
VIIVSGRIYVRAGARQEFLTSSAEAVAQARSTPGCRDFVVAADPIEPDRVNVYEEWESGLRSPRRPLTATQNKGCIPKLPFPQFMRCVYLGHRLPGWPTP